MSEQGLSEGAAPFRHYFARLLLFALPVINVVAAVLWLATGKDQETRAFAKAALLVILLLTAIALGLGALSYGYLRSALLS